MSDSNYIRKTQTSVTCFLHCGDEYLFLHRHPGKRIDPDCLNGIGGRVERAENYLDAAVRETQEETGYIVTHNDVEFAGVLKVEGGYEEEWVVAMFKIKVDSKNIPIGTKTEDGELKWFHKDKVLNSGHALVDDLHYLFEEIVKSESIFFANEQLDEKLKVVSMSISRLPK